MFYQNFFFYVKRVQFTVKKCYKCTKKKYIYSKISDLLLLFIYIYATVNIL